MKLITYNRNNSSERKFGTPSVRVNANSGTLSFNYEVAKIAGIKPGDKLELCQDEENPKDWYFTVNNKGDGFAVRGKDEKNAGVIFNNVKVAREIIMSSGYNDDKITFTISQKPIKQDGRTLWLIITSSGNTTKRQRIKDRIQEYGA